MGFFLGKDTIFEKVKELLISEFKIEPESIRLEKRLDEDLDMDSLDAVDLVVSLKEHIGEKIDPALFKGARTVQDVVDLLLPLWKASDPCQKIGG
jgi:acyl carrier protein